jgi:hypothetical protein
VREREEANGTREAGHLDKIQGVVANKLRLLPIGASPLANGANGMSDIEGKVAREAMSECGQRASFNPFGVGCIAWLGCVLTREARSRYIAISLQHV